MNEHPHADLISAYLDGEVTPQERALAERLLAEDAECRQLLEEFRSLRSGLQSLPKLKLEADFHERVLRQAERAALGGAPQREIHLAGNLAPAPLPADDPPAVFRFPRAWHAWRWAAVAAAAALLIWLAGREPLVEQRRVAQAPARPEAAPAGTDRAVFSSREPSSAEPPRAKKADPAAEQLHDLASENKDAAPTYFDVADGKAPASPAAAEAGTRLEAPARGEQLDAAGPAPPADRPALAETTPPADRARRLSKAAAAAPETAPPPAPRLADEVAGSQPIATNGAVAQEAQALAAASETPTVELLAIDVLVPEPVQASSALAEVFARNSIVVEPEPGASLAGETANAALGGAGQNRVDLKLGAEADRADDDAAARVEKAEAERKRASLAEQPEAESLRRAAPQQPETTALSTLAADAESAPHDQGVSFYYVEATQNQVRQTIEDLRARPDVFYSVVPVEVPSAGQVESWSAAPGAGGGPALSLAEPNAAAGGAAQAARGAAAETDTRLERDGATAQRALEYRAAPEDVKQQLRSDKLGLSAGATATGRALRLQQAPLAPWQERGLGRGDRYGPELGAAPQARYGRPGAGRSYGAGQPSRAPVPSQTAELDRPPAAPRQQLAPPNPDAAGQGPATTGGEDAQRLVRALFFLRPAPAGQFAPNGPALAAPAAPDEPPPAAPNAAKPEGD